MDERKLAEVVREVVKRTLLEPAFRTKALSDGNAAVKEIDPRIVPAGVTIKFVENDNKTRTIVLPDPLSSPESLTEEELEAVAGGCWVATCGQTCNQGSCVNTG